jgi:TPR repeat protein
MSLDSSEKSTTEKNTKMSDSSSKSDAIKLPDAANQEPVFKSSGEENKLGWFKYPLILLALGLIYTALILENPSTDSVADNQIQPGKGLLQSNPSTGGSDARAWIASWKKTSDSKSIDAVFEKAESFAAAEQHADAYLLYFYAARKGHGSAAMTLAKQADPQTFSEKQSITGIAEPFTAFKWYKIAVATGVPEASSSLENLKKWVQNAANEGDVDADRLLLQWR